VQLPQARQQAQLLSSITIKRNAGHAQVGKLRQPRQQVCWERNAVIKLV
jgi:hypothetical protein